MTHRLSPSSSRYRTEEPFRPGFHYEIIIETNTRRLLPSVQVWSNHGNTAIAGTLIGLGAFVDLAQEPDESLLPSHTYDDHGSQR